MTRAQPQRRRHARPDGALRRDAPLSNQGAPAAPAPREDAREDFQLERHIFFWLTEIIGRRNRLLAPVLKPFGLRFPEWRVLAALHSRHRVSFKELAELASFDQTTLSRTIDRFVRDGLVNRLSDVADMRVTRLALTAKGETLFQELWPAVDDLNRRACAYLPEGGAGMLRFLLGEMRRGLDDAQARADESRPSPRRQSGSGFGEKERVS